jgi:hypothetical protein
MANRRAFVAAIAFAVLLAIDAANARHRTPAYFEPCGTSPLRQFRDLAVSDGLEIYFSLYSLIY